MDLKQAVVYVCMTAKRASISYEDNEVLRQAFAVLQSQIIDEKPHQEAIVESNS